MFGNLFGKKKAEASTVSATPQTSVNNSQTAIVKLRTALKTQEKRWAFIFPIQNLKFPIQIPCRAQQKIYCNTHQNSFAFVFLHHPETNQITHQSITNATNNINNNDQQPHQY